jgi:1,4-alpha-glucan branching enzyme
MTIAEEVELIVGRDHPDPHHLLGAHPDGKRVVVRAFRPNAERVAVLLEEGEPVELTLAHPGGLFEGTVAPELLPAHHRLEVSYPGGLTAELVDPYSFLPALGELDLHLAMQGRHELLYEKLGARVRELDGVPGTAFAVWAPNARSISVVGDFNGWDGSLHPMRTLGASGIWELFLPDVGEGARYKFEIRGPDGGLKLKADPVAQASELAPQTASVVFRSAHRWQDEEWRRARHASAPLGEPISIYELHLGSWRQGLSYRDAAEQLGAYVRELGFTHVELMPIMEHPFGGSWGYQVTGFFAPTARFGGPDDFRAFVDSLHRQGIGVILDWVPAHFPRDDWALARFDGTALYEHADPRRGSHPDWGTLVFNVARNEVRNFLLASGLLWLSEYHADGLRIDAVASMLYLDYSRRAGEWVANLYGGREDLDNIAFLRELNEVIHATEPGVISAAEESTSWPGVSRPVYLGGLGFGFKWNMGWMHDTLDYFAIDPVYRQYHHHELTFSMIYAFSENFVLPLSHDEVVHGKGSLLGKMPGDRWQQLANLRALYAYMWAHPGKKLVFMGGELAQEAEWSHDRSLDWHLLDQPGHAGVQRLVRDLNGLYRAEPALYEVDFEPHGFRWLDANDAARNIIAFVRLSGNGERALVCVCNLSPVPRERYRVGLPFPGHWREALNTDSEHYGGSNMGNYGGVGAEESPWQGQPFSAELTLPPLAVVWLQPER